MKGHPRLVLTCTVLATMAGIGTACSADAEAYAVPPLISPVQSNNQVTNPTPAGDDSKPRTAVVLRFAVQSQPLADAAALSAQACPQIISKSPSSATGDSGAQPKKVTVEPKILDKITDEMQNRLSKKMAVLVDPDPQSIPVGALVISGCITTANGGNAAGRLIGMNVGASHLGVHVVALFRTKDGWSPADTFDLQVKGGSLLPPLGPVGLAVHAARDTQQTLSADAKKLADRILKRLAKDMKAREQAEKSS